MNGLLREGDIDAGGVELIVDLIVDVMEYGPVVVVFDPGSDGEVDAAVGQGRYEHGGFGVGLDALVGLDGLEDDVFGLVHALAVVDADGPLDATGVGAGVVDDDGRAHRTVGDEDDFVVGLEQKGVEDLDFQHLALHALHFNPVAHAIGLEQQDDQTAGKVLQVAGKGHTDGDTGRGQEGGKRGGVDTQSANDGDDEQHGEQNLDEAAQETLHAGFDVAAVEQLGHEFVDDADDETAHHEDQGGHEQMFAGRDAEFEKFAQDEVEIGRDFGGCGLKKRE